MSYTIPTTRHLIRPQYFRRTRPVCGGVLTADKPWGINGINEQINYAMAKRVRVLDQRSPINADTTAFFSTATSATYTAITAPMRIWPIGEGVTVVYILMDCERTNAYLATTTGNGSVATRNARSSIGLAVQYTIPVITGVDIWVQLYAKATTGYTCKLYRYLMKELALTTLT